MTNYQTAYTLVHVNAAQYMLNDMVLYDVEMVRVELQKALDILTAPHGVSVVENEPQ